MIIITLYNFDSLKYCVNFTRNKAFFGISGSECALPLKESASLVAKNLEYLGYLG